MIRPLLLLSTLAFTGFAPSSAVGPQEIEGIVLADKDVTISAATENVMVAVEVEEGDTVNAGQLLARLDSRTQQLQVDLWKKRLELLEVAYETSRNLGKDNIVSREEMLTAEIERDLARIQLDIARKELADTELRSAIDGVVVEVVLEPGELTRRGEALFRIVNTDVVLIQLYLPAEQAAKLALGESYEVKFPQLPDAPVETGSLTFIDPAIDPNSGFQRVRLLLPNPENRIRSGQRCRVIFP